MSARFAGETISAGLTRFCLIFVAYFLGAELGHTLSFPGAFASLWPPSGVYVASLLLLPTRQWPLALAAAGLSNLFSDVALHDKTLLVAFGFWTANTIEAVFSVVLLRRFVGRDFSLSQLRDVSIFVTVTPVTAAASAMVGASVVWWAFGADYWSSWKIWWMSSWMGAIFIAPIILTMRDRVSLSVTDAARLLNGLLGSLVLVWICIWMFGSELALPYAAFPILLWVTTTFESRGVSWAMLLIAVGATLRSQAGMGIFGAIEPISYRVLLIQSFLGITSTSFLILAATFSERRRALQQTAASEERYRDLIENTSDLVQSAAPDGTLLFVNRAWRETLGYDDSMTEKLNVFDVVHPDDVEQFRTVLTRLMEGETFPRVEVRFITRSGETIYLEGSASCRHERGRAVLTRSIFRDVTARRLAEELAADSRRQLEQANAELRMLSMTDSLTGLANRRHLEQALEREFSRCQAESQPLSLILLDVDHFKSFNDNYGHLVGDQALRKVADVLQSMSSPDDLVARFGGEEFCVLLPGCGPDSALRIADSIRLVIADTRMEPRRLTVSLGVATNSSEVSSPQALLHLADEAMYRAKQSGRNCVRTDRLESRGAVSAFRLNQYVARSSQQPQKT